MGNVLLRGSYAFQGNANALLGQCKCITPLMGGQATPTNTGTFTRSITFALIDGSSIRPSRDR